MAVLPGGRLTEEDAYAYSKFARVVLATNDIDFRARPTQREELAFLGAHVAGMTPDNGGITLPIWRRPLSCWSGSSRRRSRRSSSCGCARPRASGMDEVHSIAAVPSRGPTKLDGS